MVAAGYFGLRIRHCVLPLLVFRASLECLLSQYFVLGFLSSTGLIRLRVRRLLSALPIEDGEVASLGRFGICRNGARFGTNRMEVRVHCPAVSVGLYGIIRRVMFCLTPRLDARLDRRYSASWMSQMARATRADFIQSLPDSLSSTLRWWHRAATGLLHSASPPGSNRICGIIDPRCHRGDLWSLCERPF